MLKIDIKQSGDFGDAVFRAAKEAFERKVRDTVRSVAGAEASKVSVRITGTSLQNISADLNGPEELVKKIRAALAR